MVHNIIDINSNVISKYFLTESQGGNIDNSLLILRNQLAHGGGMSIDKSNALVYTNAIIASVSAEIFNIVIPLYDGTSVKLTIGNSVDGNYYTIYTEEVEECKYTPVTCSFVNRYGGWQQLVFFKAQTNSIAIKGSEYNLMQENWNYEPTRGKRKSFNKNGTKTIKLNTRFIEEIYN